MFKTDRKSLDLDVIAVRLLQFDHTPTSGLRVVDVFRYSRHTDGICDELNLILHTGSELVRLCVSVDVDFLGTAGDDEDGDIAGIKHAGVSDVNVSDIQDFAVGLQSGSGVLPREGFVDVVLGFREPELECLAVTLDVGVEDFGKDVFTQIA